MAVLFLSITCVGECAKLASMPLARSNAVEYDDGIEAAADALAEMYLNAPELPDLPEEMEYLVRDTGDGPMVTIVPSKLSEMVQAMPDEQLTYVQAQNGDVSLMAGSTPVYMDVELDVVKPLAQESSAASIDTESVTVQSHAQSTSTITQTVMDLNRFNFHDNVLRDGHDQPIHWIVRFCHDWYSPCDDLTPLFKETAWRIEEVVNANDQFQTTVRFADVDCSTNKPLCNEVADYHFPQVIHFHKQARFADWKGGGNSKKNADGFVYWVSAQVDIIESTAEFPTELEEKSRKEPVIPPVQWDLRRMSTLFFGMAGALAAYFWMLVRKVTGIDCDGAPVAKVDKKLPGNSTLERRRQLFTCQDMLPSEWLPPRTDSQTVIEL